MKKQTLLFVVASIISYGATSQLEKHTFLLGGNLAFSSTTLHFENAQGTGLIQNSLYAIDLSPDFGYFIADKWTVGARASFHKTGFKPDGSSAYTTYTNANYGVFSRYYLMPAEKIVNILVDGAYQFGSEKGQSNPTSKHTFTINGGPVVYFNSNVGLEFLVGYSTFTFVGQPGTNTSIQVNLGLHIHLEKMSAGSQ